VNARPREHASETIAMSGAEQTTRWRAVVAYDGGLFHGWQSQANATSVQDAIEAALAGVLGVSTRIHGSGRTDAGVHAIGQVFHFDATWRHGPERLLAAVSSRLPPGILVKSLRRARPEFHARFSAVGKRYHYRLLLDRADPFEARWCWAYPRGLDLARMQTAAAVLTGRHDFAAYCAQNGDERETTVRELRRLELRRSGRRVKIVLEADGFLYKMARSLVGAIVNVGRGALEPADVEALLHSAQRPPEVFTAPAHGLFLERVFYPRGA
jgi:tRNA pseudouridine38-40 synthase